MRISIQNRQRRYRPDRARLRDLLGHLAARLRAARPGDTWAELVLILVDDAAMSRVNREALGHAGPTDVITLEYLPLPLEPGGPSAEIVVNLDAAGRAGPPHGWSASCELALYVAHGIDHLCGLDDATPAQRARMRRRERRWLAELPAPPEGLFTGPGAAASATEPALRQAPVRRGLHART